MKFFLLILENIRRNKLRTTLTALGTMFLVLVITGVWSILVFIDQQITNFTNLLTITVNHVTATDVRNGFAGRGFPY